MGELHQREGVAARALEFCILTTASTSEALQAKWDEIDIDAKMWTVPAERMKAHKEHRAPLSDRALKLLAALPRTDKRVFPIGERAMLTLLQETRPGMTVHG